MLARKQTSIKVDPVAWSEVKEIFKEYNLSVSDAINIFLNKVRLEKGMPFDMKLPQQKSFDHIEVLRKRNISVDSSLNIDNIMNEMNNGLS
ncbi:hypothetical protein MNB_SV-13-733 [hydrothermal vent metagenome]|uniref:DNA-damage-inducible protein J n=1 Tax=hydrothermal vent metagenome TaxID=652676 RepID=A0A1W1CUU6_9ZZZZ